MDRTTRDLLNRRGFLARSGAALGLLPMAGIDPERLLGMTGSMLGSPVSAPGPHHLPKAKSVIFLFMYGGPSQVDTFDYKPKLYGLDGKTIKVKTRGRGGSKDRGRIVGPKWKFKQYGESGKWISSLFPHLATKVDDLSFIHSMYADSPIHGSAMLMMNSGRLFSGHPSIGAWLNYGLGPGNPNLPGHVIMLDPTGGPISGAKNWTSGYMPALHQGVIIHSRGEPILDLSPYARMTRERQRLVLDQLKRENEIHANSRADSAELHSRIASYELAYRMQDSAPEALDLEKEPESTRKLYGLDNKKTEDFGKKCLMARRLVQRGVRYIQLYSGGHHNDNNWDAHDDLKFNHDRHALATDKPIAGLLEDLKRTGLLDETLVVWGGEFGRQPTAEYEEGTGRDHNSYGFTMWMAGGGIRPGLSIGTTDELGSRAVTERLHVKNLHATILHQMGLDPNRLTYRFGGLDQKLVGVEGAEPIKQLI